jgi:hypothetical protein
VLRQACRTLDLPPPDEDATTAEALHRQLRQLRLQSNQQDARVVVPIDQFEEVLGRGNERNPKAAAAADAFLALLAELLAMKASQVLIIATLRCLAGMGIRLEQYETFGRLKGAVQRKADAVLTPTLPAPSAEEIAALQQAFVEHLIRLTTKGKEAKQPARRSLLLTASLRLVDRQRPHPRRSASVLSPPSRLPAWCYRRAEAWRLEPLHPLLWGCWFCPGDAHPAVLPPPCLLGQNASMTAAPSTTTSIPIDPRISEIASGITAAIPEAQVRLFGSRARGTSRPDSEVDLLITVPDQWLAGHDRVRVLGDLWRQYSSHRLPLGLLLYTETEVSQRQKYRSSATSLAYQEGILLNG